MNKKAIIIVSAVLGIVLGILIVVIVVQHNDLQQITSQMEMEKNELQEEYEELVIQFDGYQNMDIKNDSLQNLLSQEQGRVQDLLEELRITKATNAKRIAELKKELATVRAIMVTYIEQIDSLNATNTKLTKENKQIKRQNVKITEQNTKLKSLNTQLEETVYRASRLEISDMNITPLNKYDHKTKMLKQIKKVQFEFTITKNITAPRGMKAIFLRIVNPKGELLQKSEEDTFTYENSNIGYTAKQDFEFSGDEIKQVMYWTLTQDAQEGYYNADFFIDGELVGSFPFKLRK